MTGEVDLSWLVEGGPAFELGTRTCTPVTITRITRTQIKAQVGGVERKFRNSIRRVRFGQDAWNRRGQGAWDESALVGPTHPRALRIIANEERTDLCHVAEDFVQQLRSTGNIEYAREAIRTLQLIIDEAGTP